MACQKAIEKQLSVDLCVGRMNFVGLPRSGKSSTLRRLLGEFLNIKEANMSKEEPSTGVAERKQLFVQSISKTFGFAQHGKWTKKSLVGETSILNDVIQQATKTSEVQQEAPIIIQDAVVTPEETKQVRTAEKISSEQKAVEELAIPTAASEISGIESNFEESTAVDVAEVYPHYKKAIEEKDYEKVKYLLKDTIYLITTDHGGQTEFLDLMSRFLMGPSLHLIFSRLTDSWDSVFKMYCTDGEGVSTKKEDSIVTLEEITFQTLASIACMKDTDDKMDSSTQDSTCVHPKAMFVGTFRDKVSLSTFKKRDQLLRKKIEQTEFYNKDIIKYASEDFLTLALNNKTGTSEEINNARDIFENCIKENLGKVRIPCSWLMLSIIIRSKEKQTMTLNECEEIAQSLNIELSDLPKVLHFLHYRVGILLHYPEVKGFEDIIICDIQVIFDSATQLVKKTFVFNKAGQRAAATFKNKAQFTMTDLRNATKANVKDIISMEMLVTLFEYHNILAPLPVAGDRKETTYFMPSILRSATKTELLNISKSPDVAPLVLRYKCGYLPLGVFSSLTIKLISDTHLNWTFKEDSPCRNKVEFLVGKDKDTVTLICCASFIKVLLYREPPQTTPTSVVCADIRNILTVHLTEVNKELKYQSATLQYGFECLDHQVEQQSFLDTFLNRSAAPLPHVCILYEETSSKMKCLKDPSVTKIVPLTDPTQKIWFEKEQSKIVVNELSNEFNSFTEAPERKIGSSELDTIPEGYPFIMSSLILLKWTDSNNKLQKISIINEISQKWRDMSDLLGISLAKTEQIEMDKNNVRDRCREVLKLWLSNEDGAYQYSSTWEGLIKLLQDLELANLAAEVQSIVCQTH